MTNRQNGRDGKKRLARGQVEDVEIAAMKNTHKNTIKSKSTGKTLRVTEHASKSDAVSAAHDALSKRPGKLVIETSQIRQEKA